MRIYFGKIMLFLLTVLIFFTHSQSEEKTTLLLVQTIFRHGDRSPEMIYPNDPNKADCWPQGLGELTQLGKKEHYKLGKFLRSMYQDFVSSNPTEVYVNSSSNDRCLNSAEANLASFWRPEGKWKFEDDLDWQPIPIHYLPAEEDIYLNFVSDCPQATAETIRQLDSKEIKDLYQTHQKIHNLIIPQWVDTYWDEMHEVAHAVFRTSYASPIILRLRIGPFLHLITDNMRKKISGDTPDLKVQMNSAHDINVAAVLLALNFTNMARPPYCATLIFELHEMADTTMAVRLLYLNSTDPLRDMEKPQVLVLDDCSEFCPLQNFTKKYQWLIPDNWEKECQLNATHANGE